MGFCLFVCFNLFYCLSCDHLNGLYPLWDILRKDQGILLHYIKKEAFRHLFFQSRIRHKRINDEMALCSSLLVAVLVCRF